MSDTPLTRGRLVAAVHDGEITSDDLNAAVRALKDVQRERGRTLIRQLAYMANVRLADTGWRDPSLGGLTAVVLEPRQTRVLVKIDEGQGSKHDGRRTVVPASLLELVDA